ncbi:nicotinamide mononucleotide transporter family protein [Patescibacteria group bacterium]|nr:nicotinamide mononucleotide transporter family protein [Patescibacteria group bacterium]MBU4461542.1 nicotinamide mononucleotide transporter family protein [Patescibacteria group bacterium]
MDTLEIIAQVGIAFFGLSAIILVARKNKWGFVLGLISVPFWFITSIINGQWGIILLNTAYTASWIYGIYYWFSGRGRVGHRKIMLYDLIPNGILRPKPKGA